MNHGTTFFALAAGCRLRAGLDPCLKRASRIRNRISFGTKDLDTAERIRSTKRDPERDRDRRATLFREPLVIFITADVIGVAFHLESQTRVAEDDAADQSTTYSILGTRRSGADQEH